MEMTIVVEQLNRANKIKRPNSSKSTPVPPDILVEVLLRLNVESLLRCKSVCKLWCTLISDPLFVKSHLSLSTSNNRYVHHRLIYLLPSFPRVKLKCYSLYDILYDNSNNNALEECSCSEFVYIVGSCNGLLCLLNKDEFIIWNPSTRISHKFPNCDLESFSSWYGFGYHESSDDFKVVGIYSAKQGAESRNKIMRMYSFKTGKWKDIGDFPYSNPWFRVSTFSNGAFHWMIKIYDSFSQCKIISLSLATETYDEVLQPVYDDEGDRNFLLGALGEWLCVVCNYLTICADVWVMKVYGVKDSWTKLISIEYPTYDWTYSILVPLCISNDGKLLLKLRKKLVLYDSNTTSFLMINNDDGCVDPHTFVESLVSPTGLGR